MSCPQTFVDVKLILVSPTGTVPGMLNSFSCEISLNIGVLKLFAFCRGRRLGEARAMMLTASCAEYDEHF